jgi:MATE family multidrug resistance protein
MGRTRPAAVMNLIGYYMLGLPLAWWLAFRRGWGLVGLWLGLAVALMVIAILLVTWVARRGPKTMRQPLFAGSE